MQKIDIRKGIVKMEKKFFKSGFVSIIGRTNVGKSTLINLLVGEKIAIMTNKPQTTRTAIKAIINRENSQIIITDTPGIHKPRTKLGKTMNETAFESATDVDVVLFLIEADSKEIGPGDRRILEKIKEAKRKTILVINKIDLVKKEDLLKLIKIYSEEYEFSSVLPISAIKHESKELVLNEIEKLLKEGPLYYDTEEYTDQTARQLVEETIREKALKLLDDEVPHGLYVEVQKMKLSKSKEDNKPFYNIEANIYCLRESHKGIIIGKNGQMLKKIGTYARQDLEKMLGMKINLKTWVKVKEEWQDSDYFVKKFKI
jgi:GTP-binding protein Era